MDHGGTVGICASETARYSAFALCLAQLELPAGWKLTEMQGSNIGYSRQLLAQNFEGEHLLFLDDDHTFAPDLILRRCRRGGEVVVCGSGSAPACRRPSRSTK